MMRSLRPFFSSHLSMRTLAALSVLLGAPFAGFAESGASAAPEASAYRAAEAALEREASSEALRLLEGATDPLRRWLRARALLTAGQSEDALAALGPARGGRCLPVEEDTPRIVRALLRAELVGKTDASAAAEILAGLGTSAELARALLLTTESSQRRNWSARLLLDHAGSPEAKDLFEQLGAAGSLELFARTEMKVRLAEAWLDANDNDRAEALAKAIEVSGPEACPIQYILGKAARKKRNYAAALKILPSARATCEGLDTKEGMDLALRAAYLEARVNAIKGRAKKIDALVAWFQNVAPGHSYIDDILLWSAQTHRGATATAKMREVFEMKGDQAPVAAWELARMATEAGEETRAQTLLAAIPELPGADRDDIERAEHFLARLEASSSTAAAAARWERLARRPSFYGFVALERLEQVAPQRAERVRDELRAAAKATPRQIAAPQVRTASVAVMAQLWSNAGYADWAQAELRNLSCMLTPMQPEELVAMAERLEAVGDHPAAQRLVRWDRRGLLHAPLTPETAALWRVAYSRAYTDEISEAAGAEKIDPLLLTALAREESTFDPDIVSWAGATGLGQLMPPTAIGAYADVFGGRLHLERLTEPALNLRLGAHVLAEGIEQLGGFVGYGLSAYNGGAGLTRRVLAKRRVPFEVWAESNPVKENRGYVKRVMATYGIYRLLYGEEMLRVPDQVGPGAKVHYTPRK